MTIHPDDYAAHIATEADANRERFAGSYAELPTWSDWDELTEEEREAEEKAQASRNMKALLDTDVSSLDKKERNRLAYNVIGKLILRSKGLNEDYNLGDAIHD